jgi:hypothetical protein
MNTPAHVMINLLCLGRRETPQVIVPVLVGAILPDLPIFIFYAVEKLIFKTPERIIWSEAYYAPHWQNWIDLFNSIPFALIGLGIALWQGSNIGRLLFSSVLLHIAGDFPLHHDDAHRHFFPFSNWRFESPVSYWDPAYHGTLMTGLEALAVVISCIVLVKTYRSQAGRVVISMIGMLYLLQFAYVFFVWA